MSKTTTFKKHVHDAFFVHFFTVTSRLRREIPLSDVLLRTLTQDYKLFFLPLNFEAVPKNSILAEIHLHLTFYASRSNRHQV